MTPTSTNIRTWYFGPNSNSEYVIVISTPPAGSDELDYTTLSDPSSVDPKWPKRPQQNAQIGLANPTFYHECDFFIDFKILTCMFVLPPIFHQIGSRSSTSCPREAGKKRLITWVGATDWPFAVCRRVVRSQVQRAPVEATNAQNGRVPRIDALTADENAFVDPLRTAASAAARWLVLPDFGATTT